MSFGGGANNTQGYTVNGIRSSNNTVSLDGSALIDIGSNSGVIVTLNNDMVQEVKVQSSNFAAEYGAGGMNISAVTKAGSSQFSGTLYDYYRDNKFAANDRSNSIAGVEKPKSKFKYPGGNVGGPIRLRHSYNKQQRQAVLLRRPRSAAPEGRPGSRFGVVPTRMQRERRLQRVRLTQQRRTTSASGWSARHVLILRGHDGLSSRRAPGRRRPAPGGNLITSTSTPLGKVLVNLYPKPNLVHRTTASTTCSASSSRPTATT